MQQHLMEEVVGNESWSTVSWETNSIVSFTYNIRLHSVPLISWVQQLVWVGLETGSISTRWRIITPFINKLSLWHLKGGVFFPWLSNAIKICVACRCRSFQNARVAQNCFFKSQVGLWDVLVWGLYIIYIKFDWLINALTVLLCCSGDIYSLNHVTNKPQEATTNSSALTCADCWLLKVTVFTINFARQTSSPLKGTRIDFSDECFKGTKH